MYKFHEQINSQFRDFVGYWDKWSSRWANDIETLSHNSSTPFNARCAGWDTEPWGLKFEKNRIVMSAKVKPFANYTYNYCNGHASEKYKSDPRAMMNFTRTRDELMEQLDRWNHSRFYWLYDVISEYDWMDVNGTSPSHLLSVFVHLISSHYPYRDFCKHLLNDYDESKCAFIF